MTRIDYLLHIFKNTDTYLIADWVFSIFTVLAPDKKRTTENLYPFKVAAIDEQYHYYDESTKSWLPFEDSPETHHPLFKILEGVTISERDQIIQRCEEYPTRVSVGNLFLNHYTLVYAFGDFFPLQLGSLNIGKLEKMVLPYIVDDDKPEEGKITVKQMKAFISACSSVSGFAGINNASATPITMGPAKGIREFREKLLAENKDRLNDPLVVASINKQLEDYDRAYQAQDPDGGFYIKKKAFAISRMRVHSMVGVEASPISKPETITTSLSEGWKIENFPAYNNTLRSGSYSRGASTALGGAAVKDIFRMFATATIDQEDCGTKLGFEITLTKERAWKYHNRYILDDKGNTHLLTKENEANFIGKKIMVRSPGYCKQEGASYCQCCMGESIRGTNSLAAEASNVGSRMLDISMALMHGRATEVISWDIKKSLS